MEEGYEALADYYLGEFEKMKNATEELINEFIRLYKGIYGRLINIVELSRTTLAFSFWESVECNKRNQASYELKLCKALVPNTQGSVIHSPVAYYTHKVNFFRQEEFKESVAGKTCIAQEDEIWK